ncbi:MAG: NAD(P)-dependent oxidoreductase [Bacteroidota bacterium]|nr:NAD(P)-dependent oxidoreductase [Bacteroidota bacterium]
MSKTKILFIDTTHPILPEKLEKAGFICHHFNSKSIDELKLIIADYQVLIIRSKFYLDKSLINAATSLKLIGRVGSGMENIDIGYAESKNITCLNSPEGNRDAVAEHALGMLLSLTNNLNRADRQVRQGQWKRETNRGISIQERTIGIIGFGNTGSAFAQRLQGFNCTILAYDKYKSGFGNKFVIEAGLEEIFSQSDVVSFHVPLNNETRYMLCEPFIASFKKDFLLINTSRGHVVNTSDLVVAMKSGKINAAALDVLEYEAVSFEDLYVKEMPCDLKYLVKSERVLLSPHIAGWTHESNIMLSDVLATKIKNHWKKNYQKPNLQN